MFKLERSGFAMWSKVRLFAEGRIDEEEFDAVARELQKPAKRARKTGLVSARQAMSPEPIETRWNGKETVNTAEPGDWIVTLLSPAGEVIRDDAGNANTYVVKGARFTELYEPTPGAALSNGEKVFAPKGTVDAIELSGGFDILAPWGERQTANRGYLLRNGSDVYGNASETFEATYEFID